LREYTGGQAEIDLTRFEDGFYYLGISGGDVAVIRPFVKQ
jgi:hypothetical protein